MLTEKLQIFLINTLLLHIPLLALTHRQNDRQRNKYTCCAWAGGTFFPVVLLCQFLVLAGNRFWFYLLCTYLLRVQYSCGVVLVFWFWWEIVFGVTYVLSVQYSCAGVSVFGCGRKLFSKWEQVSTKKSYWDTFYDLLADVCFS